jgi:hypothetical protein
MPEPSSVTPPMNSGAESFHIKYLCHTSAIVWLFRSLLFIIIEVVPSHNYYNYLTYITISY